jgi:hypothetical protein
MEEQDTLWLAAGATTQEAASITAIRRSRRRRRKWMKIHHRKLPRSSRRTFKSDEALKCIQRDFTGRADLDFIPLYGKEFSRIFRISRTRFQKMMEDVMTSGIQFHQPKKNRQSASQASLEAKLLLPMQCLAFGIPVTAVAPYFQMSTTMAFDC